MTEQERNEARDEQYLYRRSVVAQARRDWERSNSLYARRFLEQEAREEARQARV